MWRKPWIASQEWHDVLFLHFQVDPHEIKPYILPELELDLFEDQAWIGLVLFKVKGNRLRWLPPVPGVSSFLQVNIRTYVTYKEMQGVYFLNLDVNNPMIVKMGKMRGLLPFRFADMQSIRSENTITFNNRCQSRKGAEEKLSVTFEPFDKVVDKGAFERWFAERYHQWFKQNNHLFRIDIQHLPWELQQVQYSVNANTKLSFLKHSHLQNHPIAHYSKQKRARILFPVREK